MSPPAKMMPGVPILQSLSHHPLDTILVQVISDAQIAGEVILLLSQCQRRSCKQTSNRSMRRRRRHSCSIPITQFPAKNQIINKHSGNFMCVHFFGRPGFFLSFSLFQKTSYMQYALTDVTPIAHIKTDHHHFRCRIQRSGQ